MKQVYKIFLVSFFFLLFAHATVKSVSAACGTFDPRDQNTCTGLNSKKFLVCSDNQHCCNTQASCDAIVSVAGACGTFDPRDQLTCNGLDSKKFLVCSDNQHCCNTQASCDVLLNATSLPTAIPVPPTSAPVVPTAAPGADYTPPADGFFLFFVNPLTVTGNSNPLIGLIQGYINVTQTFSTPAGFLNALMPFLFSLAGIILFVMIIWGGFEMIYGGGDTKAQEAGKQRITAALIGFTLLFISYWIAQILQVIFGVNILGNLG